MSNSWRIETYKKNCDMRQCKTINRKFPSFKRTVHQDMIAGATSQTYQHLH
jgi:hypothetical protein